jgi:hypothetical protein
MITTPDAGDAVASCPPFSPVGPTPEGFFADCNPGTGFAGTRPIAEHFNELILNLRALLTQAGVAPVKGDPTMVWRSILQLGALHGAVTLNVSTSGTAAPANPLGGDPFDTLQNAITFLARYRIGVDASVTIQIASGTYNTTATTWFYHPDGRRVTIAGNGQGATILHYNALHGLLIQGALGGLQDLTFQGDGTGGPPVAGVWVLNGGFVFLNNVTLTGFASYGLVVDGGRADLANGSTLTVSNNHSHGIYMSLAGSMNATYATLQCTNNTVSGVYLVSNAALAAQVIQTTGGSGPGLYLGAGTTVAAEKIAVDVCGTPPNARGIYVGNGAQLINSAPAGVAGDWWTWSVTANQPQIFFAEFYGLIRAGVLMALNNKGNCSPAINTLGNTQAYIQAT